MSRDERGRAGGAAPDVGTRLAHALRAAPGPTPEQALRTMRDIVLSRADPRWADAHLRQVRARLAPEWIDLPLVDERALCARLGVQGIDAGVQSYGFTHTRSGLVVKVLTPYHDSKRWLHVCAGHDQATPTWDEMLEVKRVFIGDDRRAIMVAPEQQYYVNVHPHMLHWWSGFDGDGLPEFSRGLGVI